MSEDLDRRRDTPDGGQRESEASALPALVGLFTTLVAAFLFAWAYLSDADNQWLGGFAALGLIGAGFGLAYWGRLIHVRSATDRYPLPGDDAEGRAALAAELDRDTSPLTRRGFLLALLAGGLTAFGVALAFPIGSLGPLPGQKLRRTSWRQGSRVVTPDGSPVSRDALSESGFLVAFPEGAVGSADSQVVLLRLPADKLDLPSGRETWAPEGFVAYSRMCTHAGCPVAQYEDADFILLCPCHQSAFDVLKGAEVVSGPAGRPLPQLPLANDGEGYLVAQGDFEEPVGPGYWNLP